MALGYRVPSVLVPSKGLADGAREAQPRPPPETAVTAAVFAVHLVSMPILLDRSNYLATRGTMITDPNLFRSTWTSFDLLVYLGSDLLAS